MFYLCRPTPTGPRRPIRTDPRHIDRAIGAMLEASR